ncbi:hypothetical protein Tel_13275 [Candidatus Tenderia electrophaga]|jgi:Ca2+-binding EF-hand superfamily protein|uniref:EF-hand domain-containing protein n=1 Tax=Candidatus Tenderia electrophaga TaxID=1748243 RepID=A0A0S2TFW2_9GAMM|nr:hypothetical protein Tel_13275 [Candidatus Tenderia electrophaga]
MIYKNLMAAGCVLTLLAAPAWAGDSMDKAHKDPSMQGMEQQFDKLDSNRDNKITKQELTEQGVTLADFEQADMDGDGALDEEEFAALSEE